MKLRTRSNSIRLRITKGEVAELAREGRVVETIVFGIRREDALTYALVASETVTAVGARLDGSNVVVEIPRALAHRWTGSEQVGIEASVDVGDGITLGVLIEKDFACLAPRVGEDDSDAYPHPGGTGGTC